MPIVACKNTLNILKLTFQSEMETQCELKIWRVGKMQQRPVLTSVISGTTLVALVNWVKNKK